jgi:hypothetical protein
MSRFVFVLGAGASAAAGGPLASNFMDKARQLFRSGRLQGTDSQAFELVFKAREALKAAHSKASLELGNLEALFNAFEMAALFNRLGSLSEAEVQGLPSAMRRVIAKTVEANISYKTREQTHAYPLILPPYPYEEFVDLLSKIAVKHHWPDICLITFNYDLALDYALNFKGAPHNYGLDDQERVGADFLKLHGSLNWRRCPKCATIIPWYLRNYFERFQPSLGVKEVKLQISDQFPELQHCGTKLGSEPIIVPPTWSKGSYYAHLERVWRLAAGHLASAEYIFIIGYSYPPTDEFFRYLYALGSIGEGWIERVYVFNPDAEVGRRIGTLLGPLAKDRYEALTNNFVQAISVIEKLGLS